MSNFVVLPASIPDIKYVYDVYFEAFKDELITQVLFPGGVDSNEFRDIHTKHTLSFWHDDTKQYTLKCVEASTSKIVGMALWDVHWSPLTEAQRAKPSLEWLSGKERTRAERFVEPFWRRREEIMKGEPHVYCHVVAVLPAYRRKGVGKLLSAWGIEVARQLQVPVYLESSEMAMPLYHNLGFKKELQGVYLPAEVVGEGKGDKVVPVMIKN